MLTGIAEFCCARDYLSSALYTIAPSSREPRFLLAGAATCLWRGQANRTCSLRLLCPPEDMVPHAQIRKPPH